MNNTRRCAGILGQAGRRGQGGPPPGRGTSRIPRPGALCDTSAGRRRARPAGGLAHPASRRAREAREEDAHLLSCRTRVPARGGGPRAGGPRGLPAPGPRVGGPARRAGEGRRRAGVPAAGRGARGRNGVPLPGPVAAQSYRVAREVPIGESRTPTHGGPATYRRPWRLRLWFLPHSGGEQMAKRQGGGIGVSAPAARRSGAAAPAPRAGGAATRRGDAAGAVPSRPGHGGALPPGRARAVRRGRGAGR